ncbi:MAG: 3-hydroxyacyl-CoA dehydrogenase NAD-binding domain-containing protein, partial [Bryobacteraceae bacterium]
MSAGSEFEQAQQLPPILKAGVLGAGTMGARIAAHLANAGLAVVLLDIPS